MSELPVAPLDPNKIAVEFMNANLERLYAIATAKAKGATTAIRTKLSATYGAYLARLLERHSKAKSFFIRADPTPLYDFFVPLDLSTPNHVLEKASAEDVAAVNRFAIISGSGGSGKSMLMRHLLISALQHKDKTPIFLELRHLNQRDQSLLEAVLENVRANGLEIDEAFLVRAMEDGRFLFLLDGYDELERKSRPKVIKTIRELSEKFPSNWYFLSSRPDSDLEGLSEFTVFRVNPLTLNKAVELVHKLPFESDVKSQFIRELKGTLFEQHESFLSNPLLLSIMLLTYQDTAHIPSKLSIFYNQAYEALFLKHDALKGGYKRERQSNLDIQDFSRVFAAFSVQSYDKREFIMPRDRARAILRKAKDITHADFEVEAYLTDAIQSVCLLVDEGMDVAFAHRSFQEYFAAVFVANAPPTIKAQLTKRFTKAAASDTVMYLLYELDPYTVETHYLLPSVRRFKKAIEVRKAVTRAVHLRAIKLLFVSIRLGGDDDNPHLVATIRDRELYHALRFASDRYAPSPALATGEIELRRKEMRAEYESFESAFGRNATVAVETLELGNPFVEQLSRSTGAWGIAWTESFCSTEATIRRRINEAKSSIDDILSS